MMSPSWQRSALLSVTERAVEIRSVDSVGKWLFILLVGATIIAAIPILFFLLYTLLSIIPLLGIVIEDMPPSYEALALEDPDQSKDLPALPTEEDEDVSKPLPALPFDTENGHIETRIHPTVIGLTRYLYSHTGWRSFQRGLKLRGLENFVCSAAFMLLTTLLPAPLAYIAASILLWHFSTIWNHNVLSKHPTYSFFKTFHRGPSLLHTLRATGPAYAISVISAGMASTIYHVSVGGVWHPDFAIVPFISARSLQTRSNDDMPKSFAMALLMASMVVCIALLLFVSQLPAHAVLYRVQASLIPAERETIVPFSRTFGISGEAQERGFLTMSEAWKSLSWSFWKRILKLHAQIGLTFVLVFVAAEVVMALEYGLAQVVL